MFDKQIEQIMQELLKMTPEERKELLAVARFLIWRDTKGAIKTDEIAGGQILYYWYLAHQ